MFHFLTIGTGTYKELCHTLLGTAVGIGEVVAFMNGTAHHLEVLHFADVGFHAGFEEVDGSGAFGVELDFLTARVMNGRHFVNKGYYVAKEFHQTSYAHVLGSTNAEHGEDAARYHTFADAFAHFVFGELFGFKEFLHQPFVVFSGCLNESAMHGFSAFFFCFGNIF